MSHRFIYVYWAFKVKVKAGRLKSGALHQQSKPRQYHIHYCMPFYMHSYARV